MKFLRGCGLKDWEIESAKLYDPSLTPNEIAEIQHAVARLRADKPLQKHNVFISYSTTDSPFVDALESKLNGAGIHFWRDIHDAVAGRLDQNIERGIRQNPIVLLVLSEHSTQSDWVEHEVTLATQLKHEIKHDVLCPIALDDAWKTCDWNAPLRTQIMKYTILDFSQWQDSKAFDDAFRKIKTGLDLFYPRAGEPSDDDEDSGDD